MLNRLQFFLIRQLIDTIFLAHLQAVLTVRNMPLAMFESNPRHPRDPASAKMARARGGSRTFLCERSCSLSSPFHP